jgi:hypothetical protein
VLEVHDVAPVPGERLVEERPRLLVEHRERSRIARVHLGNQRSNRRRTREYRLGLARAGRELGLAQEIGVVRVGRHDRQSVGLCVEDDRADAHLFGEALRDHMNESRRHLGLRQLLGRYKKDSVVCGERLEHVRLGDKPEIEDDFLDALAHTARVAQHRIDLIGLEELVANEHIADAFRLLRRRWGSLGGGHLASDRTR